MNSNSPSLEEEEAEEEQHRSCRTSDLHLSSAIQWQTAQVHRILGDTPDGKLIHTEDEAIYHEKLLKLAFHMSELSFLQAKQETMEDRFQLANGQRESHAVIEVGRVLSSDRFHPLFQHLSDDLNQVQTQIMNKISDVQELKLVLHNLRTDNGQALAMDLEQVTIELKLDEIVHEHVVKLRQQSSDDADVIVNESTLEQALLERVSSPGTCPASPHETVSFYCLAVIALSLSRTRNPIRFASLFHVRSHSLLSHHNAMMPPFRFTSIKLRFFSLSLSALRTSVPKFSRYNRRQFARAIHRAKDCS